ncbi:MAG: hypothetical protein AB1503_04115 [Bacillota bacterium]|nr:hypothetical protein [Bacillota bacterium]
MKEAGKRRLWAAFPFLVVLLLVAFHYQRFLQEQLRPPGPSFGRPLELASSDMSGSTAAQAAPDGDLLVLWSVRGGIDYILVSPQALVKARGHIPLQVDTPTRSPTSLLAGSSALFWLAGPALTELYWAPLSLSAPSLGSPVHLGGGISMVRLVSAPPTAGPGAPPTAGPGAPPAGGASALAAAPAARSAGLLAAGPEGLLWFPLDASGHPGQPQRVPRPGMTLADGVSLARDRVAVVGVIQERGSFQLEYLELGGTAGAAHPVLLGEYPLEEHELLRQVRCGTDGEWMYVFVTREKRQRGNLDITTYWQAWPATRPPAGAAGGLAPLRATAVAARHILWLAEPDPAPSPQGGLPVAFTALNRGRRGQDEDVLVARFLGGRMVDCQFAALTRGAAGQPHLVPAPAGPAIDDGGYFLTWVDTAGTGRFRLRFTASVPVYRQAMARVRLSDLTAALGETLAGAFLSYLPFLFALGWTVPALLVLVAAHAVALNWAEQHPRPLGILALGVYLAGKGWLLWRLLHAPVLAMRAPPWVTPALTLPILLGAAGLAGLTTALRHRDAQGLARVGRFVLWDVLFTCLFLGPVFR